MAWTRRNRYLIWCVHFRKNGLSTEYDFRDGQEIIQKIIDGLTNDGRFLCRKGCWSEVWIRWIKTYIRHGMNSLIQKIRSELIRDWGEAPGDFMSVHGKILIPGIRTETCLLASNPPRPWRKKRRKPIIPRTLYAPTNIWPFTNGWRRCSRRMSLSMWGI